MSDFSFETFSGALLGPMAGVADSAFRRICVRFGAAATVSEMVSAKALCFQDAKSRDLMVFDESERPFGIQLFGDDPAIMARAAGIAESLGPDFIDINMGCPVPKIAGNGSGAALMRRPELAYEIVKAVCGATDLPVSVKLRKGWDETHVNAVEIAQLAEKAGAAAVTVHGRTKAQGYAFPVDSDIIRQVRQAVSIPVVGNGGITDAAGAAKMLEQTGCRAVMIAQGALGNPFVFEQITAWLTHGQLLPPPDISRRLSVMLEHCKLICALKGEKRGMLDARKHAAWYIKGIDGAARFRREAVSVSSYAELEALAASVLRAARA